MTGRPALLAWTAAALVALAYPFAVDPYWLTVGILALFYAIVTASWTLLVGYAGQFSFGHMGFVALGAYASALMVRYAGLPIPLAGLAAVALCLAVGACIGGVCLR
ncbi:MAG: branched-chain amino acid ABC transporter permease, partial [Acetobacteraceae bacterium]|nr:branched-chain amino acid ABC transporter permease [Acetobacteraceae bacterium]